MHVEISCYLSVQLISPRTSGIRTFWNPMLDCFSSGNRVHLRYVLRHTQTLIDLIHRQFSLRGSTTLSLSLCLSASPSLFLKAFPDKFHFACCYNAWQHVWTMKLHSTAFDSIITIYHSTIVYSDFFLLLCFLL